MELVMCIRLYMHNCYTEIVEVNLSLMVINIGNNTQYRVTFLLHTYTMTD